MSASEDETWNSIAQFSRKDADAFVEYEDFLSQVRDIVTPLLDGAPPELATSQSWRDRRAVGKQVSQLIGAASMHRSALPGFYELLTAPATVLLNKRFESEILKTTLATDAVIGAMCSPSSPGSGYVLLHHAMGQAAGRQGVWAYVEGGMGAVSESIATAARAAGADIRTNTSVRHIKYSSKVDGATVTGVELEDGTILEAKAVLSNATPYDTVATMLADAPMPEEFRQHIEQADYACGAFKINCAVDALPSFTCMPPTTSVGPEHRGTVHFETHMHELESAYADASLGIPAARPVIEMTIPSSLDTTVAPPGP